MHSGRFRLEFLLPLYSVNADILTWPVAPPIQHDSNPASLKIVSP
ncbi:hypothetical protein Cflav_PD2980 [Pedosphaera parvula Ellin514]|uniref:Uncharacterized protein n=1 Tax=Pedosphaera parvula (strain Ellin514) TaxID=320771 RepID=B9XIM1_PEDPL|nr:hypothetical protein Cflav_PD2980 [Pedosphaera parvula Ellin514]